MSLLTRIGLGELVRRPGRERATFFFLVAVSTFLFMDQNLMAPNLTAIGEELVISRQELLKELHAGDPQFRALEEAAAGEAHAREVAAGLAKIRAELLAAEPSLGGEALEARILEGAKASHGEADLAEVKAVGDAVRQREERITAAFQKQVDRSLAGNASLWFWILGGAVAVAVGYVTDKWSRKKLLFTTILIGALPCLLTGFARNGSDFVALRAATGIGIGAVLPLTYSLLGDLFSARARPASAAWIGLASGIGIAGGQLLAGLMGPVYGWRLPFILVAIPNLVLAFLFLFIAADPKRGSGEAALRDALDGGAEYTERIHLSDLRKLFSNRTNLLAFAQGIPGSMPWGFFFTFLIDYYHQNKGFSVQEATLLVTVFGAGAIAGGFAGGLLGGWLYEKKRSYLPALCLAAIVVGMFPILAIVNWPQARGSPLEQALQTLGYAGSTASIAIPALLGVVGAFVCTMPSSNVKAVIIDVNPPENRGTIMSLFNLADDLGKGGANFLIGVMVSYLGRVTSYNITILMWILCAVVWIALIRIFPRDVEALEKKMADRARELQAASTASAPPAAAMAAGQ